MPSAEKLVYDSFVFPSGAVKKNQMVTLLHPEGGLNIPEVLSPKIKYLALPHNPGEIDSRHCQGLFPHKTIGIGWKAGPH